MTSKTKSKTKAKRPEPGWVELQQVRPGAMVEVELIGDVVQLLYKTEGSAYVKRKKNVACFGTTVDVDRGERISLYTVVRVVKPAPPNFVWEDAFKQKEAKRAEGSRTMGNGFSGNRPKKESARANTPYALVDDLLVAGGRAQEIYERVKEAFPEYTGSAASISSRKVKLKKDGRLGSASPNRVEDAINDLGDEGSIVAQGLLPKETARLGLKVADVASRIPVRASKDLPLEGAHLKVGTYKTPYEMVDALLAAGSASGDIYGAVSAAFPDYAGSKDSIASRKSRLKKEGRL